MSSEIGIDGERKPTREEDEEEQKSSSSPPDRPCSEEENESESVKPGGKGAPLTLDVVHDEESAIQFVSERFGLCTEHSRAVIQECCRKLRPDDFAMFFCYRDADRIHQALSLNHPAGPRPCAPGTTADESKENLQAWVRGLMPTGNGTKSTLVLAGPNGDVIRNLTIHEYNTILPQVTFHPADFSWVAAIRVAGLSCGKVLTMTGSGVLGEVSMGKLASTIFFDE
ncbi:hypothetical protein ACA910_002178 [Epithemia clementina (nom. ined.)]